MGQPAKRLFPVFLPEMHVFGGYERILVEWADWMRERGAPFEVVCFHAALDLRPYGDVSVRQLLPRGGGLPARALAFRRWAATLDPSRVAPILISLQSAKYAAFSRLARYYLRIADTPSLMPAGTDNGLKTSLFAGMQARGLRRAAGISTDANYQAREFMETWGVQAEVHRIGTQPVQETFTRRFPVAGPIHILSVCRVEESKRIDWILRSLASIRSAGPPMVGNALHLDIVGQGSYEGALRALATELGLSDAVTFHGFVPDVELAQLFAGSHLFAMPARQGYGIPALEAMGRGLPVVLDCESGISDILGRERWAYISDGTEASFLAQLAQAARDIGAGAFNRLPPPALPSWNDFFRQLTTWSQWNLA